MNGRVYDPDLGRFVSADPHIQFEKNTQSYNRYSYVSNNPLKYTDPSGYFLDKVFKEIGRFADRVKAELQRMSPELTTALSIGLSFLPGGAWIAGGFNAAVAEANGASFGQIATSFGVGFMGGQLGGTAAKAANLTQYTAAFGAVQGAVSGAFTGGINAIINDTDIGEGILEGAASGAAIGAFVGAIQKDPGNKTKTSSKESKQQQELRKALDYLDDSESFREIYDKSQKLGVDITIDPNADRTYFDHETNTVVWNPYDGNDISAGIQSPAIGLAHELSHAVRFHEVGLERFLTDLTARARITQSTFNEMVVSYGVSPEEARATAFEQTISRELGEPVRENYRDAGRIRVSEPTFSCFAGSKGCQ